MALDTWRKWNGCFPVSCAAWPQSNVSLESDSLVFGAPTAWSDWREAMTELIKTDFSLRNNIKGHSPTRRNARHFLFDKITKTCWGAIRVQNSSLKAGDFFILLLWHTKVLSHPNFYFLFWTTMSLSYWTCLKPNLLSNHSGLSLLSLRECFPDHVQGTLVVHMMLLISILWF